MRTIEINHHYPNSDPDIARRLGRIEKALTHLIEKVEQMALDFTRLESEVSELGTVVDSVVLILTNVAEEIRNTPLNQGKINALADSVDAKAQALGVAAQANTPADPTS